MRVAKKKKKAGMGNGEQRKVGVGWVRVEREKERVHWSELGHQRRVGKTDEKETGEAE